MLVFCANVVIGVITVSAATESDWIESPGGIAGRTTERSAATRCYVAVETVQAEHAYFVADILSFDSLQSNFVSTNARELYIDLMELDDKNEDDFVHYYIGRFSGRKLNSISDTGLGVTGNIEAEGDNAAELYIKMCVMKIQGDPSTALFASGLFEFKVGMGLK